MAILSAGIDPDFGRASWRLLVACLLSAALHFALLFSVPVNPTAGAPGGGNFTIVAKLEPALPTRAAIQSELISPPRDDRARPAGDLPVAEVDQRQPATRTEPKPAIGAPPPNPNAGIDVPLARDPTYYPAKQLDAYPEPLTPIRLRYPETAAADRIDGRLLLALLIDEFGVVTDVTAIEAEPPGYFEDAVRAEFGATRFKPGTRQGRAVKSRVLVQVRYVYGEREGALR